MTSTAVSPRVAQFLLGLVIMMLNPAANLGQVQKDRCSFNPDMDQLSCSLRTLNDRNGTLISASRAKSISIQCSDVFFYESFLRTNHFGYLPDLSNLELTFCKIRKVPSLAFSGLPDLNTLTIQSRNSEWSAMVMELEVDSLTGLRNLRELNLTQNNLWTLPPHALCDLKMLQVLNLSSNFIQDILDLGFSSKGSRECKLPLQELDLSRNSISLIPGQGLGQLSNLEVLNLAENDISVLDDEAFAKLHKMTSINLSNNELVALPPYIFSDTRSLQEIYLQNNSLNALAPGVFSGLDNLLVLNISRNVLTNDWLNTRTFEKLKNLIALDLSYNRLTQVDKNLFNELVSLQILNLKFNRIHTVEANTFSLLPNLHILNLSHNRIDNLPGKAIHSLGRLSSVSLDHNLISNLHRNFLKNCTNLQDLSLQNNKLQEIPKAVKHLQLLRTLDMGYNQISQVKNESFRGLTRLYGLRLSNNKIKQIHQAVFDEIPSLQVLNLAHNDIDKLEQNTLQSLTKLKVLRLDNNKLEDINGLLTTQSELKWLNISSNQLHWFDYAFIPRSVRWLDIHDNNLEDIGNYYDLSDGFGLLTLDASNNKIKRLSANSILQSLEYVFLNENQIDAIEVGTFASKPNLKRVDLRSNELQTVSMSSISTAASKEKPEIFLGGNPLVCDCNMQWLQDVNSMSSSQYPRVVDVNDIECKLLNSDSRTSLMNMRQNQFLCQYEAHCFALCKCCDFFACDCRMQCPKGCSCYHDSAWSVNVIQCSKKEHQVLPPLIPMDATSIYLDGNNFSRNLEGQAFIGRKRVTSLYLNNSQISSISNQTLNGLSELEILDLHSNLIRSLKGFEFSNLTSLKKLDLGDNLISDIDARTFKPLRNLETLVLSGNRLKKFPFEALETDLPRLKRIYLSGNSWSCDCDVVKKFRELKVAGKIGDVDLIHCFSSEEKALVNLSANISCTDAMAVTQESDKMQKVLPFLIGVIVLAFIIVCVSVLLFVFRTPLKIWLHSKYGLRISNSQRPHNHSSEKMYDALIAYSHDDQEFVHQVLAPRLEQEDKPYRLFLQHRDLPKPSPMSETFPGLNLICSKLVLVVTKSFIEQEWSELKYFLQSNTLKKKANSDKPIIIMLTDISNLHMSRNPDLELLLKSSTVIRWNEVGFWNKFLYHLPETSSRDPAPTLLSADKPFGAQEQDWPYGMVINSNNSSTSTRSTIMGGSPKTLVNESSPNSQANNVDQGSDSVYSWQDHTYQSIPNQNPIYQTLQNPSGAEMAAATGNLGCIDVMLPNGQMVPATLVRNHTGKIVPVVEFNNVINNNNPPVLREPPVQPSEEHQPLRQMAFPRTIVYHPRQDKPGHLV